MISVRGVRKGYADGAQHILVLDGIDLEVPGGASVALTGPSGSGKSTLLNILAGTMAADAGEVLLSAAGEPFALHALGEAQRTRVRRSHIGYVHQFFNLVPTLTVLENVLMPAYLNGVLDGACRERAARLLAEIGLEARSHAFPDTLSGGEQQRVAVLRALLLRPAVVLADEPTGNLDAQNSAQVAAMLFAAARETGASLVVATHSGEVAAMADHEFRLNKLAAPAS